MQFSGPVSALRFNIFDLGGQPSAGSEHLPAQALLPRQQGTHGQQPSTSQSALLHHHAGSQ